MATNCKSGASNTGSPKCLNINEPTAGLGFQETYDSTGTENQLLGSSIGTANYLTGLTNQMDATKRIFPLQNIIEVEDVREDDDFFTTDTKISYKVGNGTRNFNGEMIENATPELLGELEKMTNKEMSVYLFGNEGGLFGDFIEEGKLRGFKIVRGSMALRYVKAKANVKPAHIQIKFAYDELVQDKNIKKFVNDDIADNVRELKGLLTVNGIVDGAVTITAFDVNINAIFGDAKELVGIENLVLADFVYTEISPTPGATTITSVSNVAEKYTITVPTTSADVNVLTLSQSGYDKGYELVPLTVTTP